MSVILVAEMARLSTKKSTETPRKSRRCLRSVRRSGVMAAKTPAGTSSSDWAAALSSGTDVTEPLASPKEQRSE